MTHHPRLPDLRNLRDVGGLRTHDGLRVRHGRLFRSASPSFVDAEQVRLLGELLGIRTRVDLRSTIEIDEAPNEHLAAAGHDVAHLPLRAGGGWRPHPDAADANEAVALHYTRYLEHSPDSLTAFVRLATERTGTPMLVHCSAGKDRTGVALAVMLSAVGVTHDEIVEDYARTREDLGPLFAQLRRLPAYRTRLAALPEESFTAEPRSMRLFLERLESEYGGARAYLAGGGVDEDTLHRLAETLLE